MNTPNTQDLEISALGALAPPPRPPSFDPRPSVFTDAPRLGWLSELRYGLENYALQKSVKDSYLLAQKKAYEAELQGAVVAPSLDAWGLYDTPGGVTEPTGQTFGLLRAFAHKCEPVGAIHNKRIEQIASYCTPAEKRWGKCMTPGFRIRMTRRGDKATPEDRENIENLQQYFLEAGYCPPPAEERPIGWQPGLEGFVRAIMRDQLTLDWMAVRTWPSARDAKKFPIVAFAAVDSALIRKKRRVVESVKGGVNVFAEQDNERKNIKPKVQITHVKVDCDVGGRVLEEYSDEELFTTYFRPRTDQNANGYGYSVLEQALTAITVWCAARDLNALRFDRDAAPRGILTVLGQMNPQQFNKFVQDWKGMMLGIRNRHTMPILQGSPVTGSSVTYTPIDPNPRDMEYSQFTFAVGLWMHCLYGIHPDETGFSASSPFRPPLSEASPEANLTYSQDTGLSPLLRGLANMLNRHILWRMHPDRRYTFEFVGMGQFNLLDDINERTASMTAGLTTPLMNWNELDITNEIDPQWVKHPAAKMPGLFAQNLQLLMSMQQGQQQEAQADQQQEQGAADQQAAGEQQEKDDAQQDTENEMAQADQEHSHNMDKFKAGLEQQKMLSGQGGDNNVSDDNKSIDKNKKISNNTIARKESANSLQPERAPGFMSKSRDDESSEGGSEPGKRYGGGASTRPMAKKPLGKAVDLAGMQKAIDASAATAEGIRSLAAGQRGRIGQVIIKTRRHERN